MPFSFRPGSVERTFFLRAPFLLSLLILAGCRALTAVPGPTPTTAIDPALFPTQTGAAPAVLSSSTPFPSMPATTQPAETALAARQEDRIMLSFTVQGHEHLIAYFPLSQPFTQLTSGNFDDRDPSVSPDGTKIAFSSNRSGYWDLYLLDLVSGEFSQLTNSQAYDGATSWSPDGQWLTYETYNGTNFDIVVMPVVDKSTPAIQLTQNSGNNFSPRWSPAGREIAFVSDRSGSNEIWAARLDLVEGRFVKVIGTPGVSYTAPAWSPDGTMLAWTRTVQGSSTIEIAAYADIAGSIRSYGIGQSAVWSQDGTALLVQLADPNAAYLCAYRVDNGVLLFPAEYFPSVIHGMDWRTATLINGLPAADPQPELQPSYPLWQKASSTAIGITERQNLAALDGIKAPYAYLHPSVVEPFQSLKAAASSQLGWDFLSTLEDAVLPISSPPQPGIEENWLYTGRAINVNSAPLQSNWMTVTREDFDGKVYWRVWVRCFNQDGSCGEPQKAAAWDFSSRYQGDEAAYEEGGKLGSIPAGYWVDFTRLALAYGFERPSAMSNWRSYFQGTLFNQFILKQGLSWNEAMLQLYPADAVNDLSGSIPLPVQQ